MAGIDGILKDGDKKANRSSPLCYSATLSRSGFTGTTFTCLIIFSCTSRISISYCSMRTRVPATGISSSASRITPLTVRASSSGRCQLNALLISRTLAVPSIMTEPSFCGVTSSASVGDIDVVKSRRSLREYLPR